MQVLSLSHGLIESFVERGTSGKKGERGFELQITGEIVFEQVAKESLYRKHI